MEPISNSHLEAALEASFRKRVRALGGHAVKLAPTEHGVPDRLVMLPGGRLYLVELKTTTGRLSPGQVQWHRRARALGINVAVLHGNSEVIGWLAGVTEEYRRYLMSVKRRARAAGITETTAP